MTHTLQMFCGMIDNSGDLPNVPATLYDPLEAKFRGVDASTAFSSACLLWLSWPGRRGNFWNFYLANFDKATQFVRLIGSEVSTEAEAHSWLLLWIIYDSLSRLGMADEAPFQCFRFARNLPMLLENWPAAELQRSRESLESQALVLSEQLERKR